MKQQLLLLQDVEALGKKGEIVSARPGYVRNFLLPRTLAVVASPNTLRKQEGLRSERAKQAVIDRKDSEDLAAKLEGLALEIKVKVDPEGHMYGSVSAGDIAQLLVERGFVLEKRAVQVTRPIKAVGAHKIVLKLKEGVQATCQLTIIAEGIVATGIELVTAPIPVEGEQSPAAPEVEPS